MASRVAERKAELGWRRDCPKCGNCKNYTSDMFKNRTTYGEYIEEKNKRCGIGVFATGKSCWCRFHEYIGK